jgi:uncharacterized protein YndB with AHSA1/START domain
MTEMVRTDSTKKAVVTLPRDDQILITREFDAPKHLVYMAFTTPELIERWWSGERGEVTSIDVDLRVGGSYRYVMMANGGFEVAFHGEYREIIHDERLVYTEVYEGAPDAAAETTVTLAEESGRTTMTILVQHDSPANRDMHIDSGMEQGLQEALQHLDEVAQSLR